MNRPNPHAQYQAVRRIAVTSVTLPYRNKRVAEATILTITARSARMSYGAWRCTFKTYWYAFATIFLA